MYFLCSRPTAHTTGTRIRNSRIGRNTDKRIEDKQVVLADESNRKFIPKPLKRWHGVECNHLR